MSNEENKAEILLNYLKTYRCQLIAIEDKFILVFYHNNQFYIFSSLDNIKQKIPIKNEKYSDYISSIFNESTHIPSTNLIFDNVNLTLHYIKHYYDTHVFKKRIIN
jgi:hypothetical protein